jgi:hypothetical protein
MAIGKATGDAKLRSGARRVEQMTEAPDAAGAFKACPQLFA